MLLEGVLALPKGVLEGMLMLFWEAVAAKRCSSG